LSGQFHPYLASASSRCRGLVAPTIGAVIAGSASSQASATELAGYRAPLQTCPILIEWPSLPLNGLSASQVIDEYGLHAEIPELRGYQGGGACSTFSSPHPWGRQRDLGYNFKSASTAARALF
jgi:hypothetical protein